MGYVYIKCIEKAKKDGNKTWGKSGRNYISTWYLHVIVAHSKTCCLPRPKTQNKCASHSIWSVYIFFPFFFNEYMYVPNC